MVGDLGLSHERGWGLLRALDLGAEIAPRVVAYARDRLERHPGWESQGLLLNAPRPELIRLMPALNVTRDEIDRALGGLRLAIEAVR
jgi:acetylornithine/N-succinyldiaminopimelate aminotransferase